MAYDIQIPECTNIVPYLEWCISNIGPELYTINNIVGSGWKFMDIIKDQKHAYIRFDNSEDATAFKLTFNIEYE